MKFIAKILLFLLSGILIGYLLLVMVFCLPSSRIQNNVLKSANSFDGEYNMLIHDNVMTKTDDFTDALMLLIAGDDSDKNPFTAAIYAYHMSRSETSPNELINDLQNPMNKTVSYSRYWHGYLLFLKPLLLLFDYGQIQVLISFLVVVLVVITIYMMQKRGIEKYIIPYVITIAFMFPMVISLSLQYIVVFTIVNLTIVFLLYFFDKIVKKKLFFFAFMVVGMTTCFFDLLTYPIVTLGLPLIIWLLLKNNREKMPFGANIKEIILGVIAWGVGYFGIWFGKWALGSIITGRNLFISAFDAASSRASTTMVSEHISRWDPILQVFENCFSGPFMIVIVCAIIIIIILLLSKRIRIIKKNMMWGLWILVVGLIPLVWYMVFANHSVWHLFFTYRTMSVLVFAVGCYISCIIEKSSAVKTRKGKNG